MKLIDAQVETFLYKNHTTRDTEGHTHPGPEQDAKQTLLRLVTDEGIEGYAFGGASPEVVRQIVRPMLLGEDPLMRERIWQRMKERQRLHLGALNDKVLSAVDQALWDLAGRALNQPVYKLLGGFRDKVPAYASTMCGDDLEGGLKTPEDYARFAAGLPGARLPGLQAAHLDAASAGHTGPQTGRGGLHRGARSGGR